MPTIAQHIEDITRLDFLAKRLVNEPDPLVVDVADRFSALVGRPMRSRDFLLLRRRIEHHRRCARVIS